MRITSFTSLFFLILFSFLHSQNTASQQVTEHNLEAGMFDGTRRIWVYVPQEYQNSKKHFPVIYMFDGQNVFDKSTSYAGEWEVDEFLDRQKGRHIVVAIAHGNENRINELTPFKNRDYGGGQGDAFLNFILNSVKPYIDKEYRTLTSPRHTTIAGASLGGLMAYYALLKHPEVFKNCIALSPSFWINPEILDLTESIKIPDSIRLYLAMGTEEGEMMHRSFDSVLAILSKKELKPELFHTQLVEGGKHNEDFWKQEFAKAYKWMFMP